MKRLSSFARYALAGLAGFFLALMLQWVKDGAGTTVTRLSPDDTIRARLVERSPSWAMDRNCVLYLDFLDKGQTSWIFHSPDQSQMPGSERLVWSKDRTKLLLVGRHFYVKEDLFCDNGDQLYFLYDLPSKQGWWNSDTSGQFPQLEASMVEGIEFTEPVHLKTKM